MYDSFDDLGGTGITFTVNIRAIPGGKWVAYCPEVGSSRNGTTRASALRAIAGDIEQVLRGETLTRGVAPLDISKA